MPSPLFGKEGEFLPFAKRGQKGLSLPCLYNYGLTKLLSFAKVMKPVHGTVVMGRGGFSLPNQGD